MNIKKCFVKKKLVNVKERLSPV